MAVRYKEISQCRLCGSENLNQVLELKPTPPANNLIDACDLDQKPDLYPLGLCQCPECTHVQLKYVVDPALLFSHYLYESKTSPVMLDHLKRQAEDLSTRFGDKGTSFVLEIGSNDGSLLKNFQRLGHPVLGVDPATNIVQSANEAGVPTLNRFFNEETAEEILQTHPKADIICANHCFAHIDDIDGVVLGAKKLMTPTSVFVFEVGYLLDVFQNGLFDTIYHEHLDYHHVKPLQRFFQKHGMTLFHAERHDIQGGALRGFVKLGLDHPVEPSIPQLLELEENAGINDADNLTSFGARIKQLSVQLKDLLKDARDKQQKVYGFGVPAKATTLLYNFAIGGEDIPLIVDDNPLKQGKFIQGLNIPIFDKKKILEDQPEYVLILAWNFAKSIAAQNIDYLKAGGTFIVPLPTLHTITLDDVTP